MPPPRRTLSRLGAGYRAERDSDRLFLQSLYASTRAEEVRLTGWPAELQERFLAQQFAAQHQHYRANYPRAEWLIIEDGGRPIGRLYLEEWEREIRIIDISLAPDARGRGIGGAILADVMEDAGSRGKFVSIHVEVNNPARSLYERLGFTKAGEHGIYELMHSAVGGAPS